MAEKTKRLSWQRSDPEQRLAFAGGRFTAVSLTLSGILGGLLCVTVMGALYVVRQSSIGLSFYRDVNTLMIATSILFFFCWAAVILWIKLMKIRLQSRALHVQLLPEDHTYVLTPTNVDEVIDRLYDKVDDPEQFILLNRLLIALSNLRNLGRVGDVDEILGAQADHDESMSETSYLMVQGFLWALPVLGFIGTVLGLSQAIGGFGVALSQSTQMDQLKTQLQSVTSGLSTAFETTLQGLLAALVIQLLMIAVKKAEEEFLDDCKAYCVRNVVSRLKLLHLDQNAD